LGGRQQIGYAAAVEKAGGGVGGGVDDASSVRGRVVRRFIVTEQRGGRGALMGGAVAGQHESRGQPVGVSRVSEKKEGRWRSGRRKMKRGSRQDQLWNNQLPTRGSDGTPFTLPLTTGSRSPPPTSFYVYWKDEPPTSLTP
jgi:hypothetical protein